MTKLTIDLRMINSSGIGTYLRNLIPLILENMPNYSYVLIGNEKELINFKWVKSANVEIINCSVPIYSIMEQIILPRIIPKDTSLFWSPHYNIPIFYRGRLMVTIHDMLHLALPKFAKGFMKQLYALFMFRMVCRKAKVINCISSFTKKELLTFCGKICDKVVVTHLGVEEQWFNISAERRPHSNPYIICVGNVKPHKNIKALILAFEKIVDKIPHDLIIIGKKEGFITGDQQVEELAEKIGGRIIFTGYLDHQILEQYYFYADALIFPSLYEGFGLPPLEAMACGCPVIASNAAAIPEICGESVLYCDPDSHVDLSNKIEMLLSNVTLKNSLSIKGQSHARKYSWSKCSQQLREMIDEVISK